MGERQEVEVLANCTQCGGVSSLGCGVCKGSGYEVVILPTVEDSLTAARLRLADAAEAMENAEDGVREAAPGDEYDDASVAHDCAVEVYQAALAALRTKRGGD